MKSIALNNQLMFCYYQQQCTAPETCDLSAEGLKQLAKEGTEEQVISGLAATRARRMAELGEDETAEHSALDKWEVLMESSKYVSFFSYFNTYVS